MCDQERAISVPNARPFRDRESNLLHYSSVSTYRSFEYFAASSTLWAIEGGRMGYKSLNTRLMIRDSLLLVSMEW